METRKRTLLKTLSWRFIATIITASLAWGITGESKVGLTVGLADTIIKFFVYYFHERTWTRFSKGYKTTSGE